MSQICKIIRDPANQVIQVLVLDSSSGNVIATAIVPRYFSGSGPPSPSTLANIFQYKKYDRYTDTTAVADYLCTSAGTNSTSTWKQISGSGGGASVQKMYVTSDQGPTITCTTVPPADYTLSAASGSGGTGYTVGQILSVPGGTVDAAVPNNVASVKITSIGANGVVTGAALNNAGAYTVAPTSPQTLNGAGGAGASFNLPFNHPIPVSVQKPPDLSTALTGLVYKSNVYTFTYQASAAMDAGTPPGNPGMVYYTRTINRSDGTSENDSIAPPYLWGGQVIVATLADGSLQDITPGRRWEQF